MENNTTTKICRNCEYSLASTYQFCPNCGQEHGERIIYFKQFILDFLGDYFTFDSKIIRSIKPLLFSPGYLTLEYLEGRRASYIPPLRMYIFISILFFLLLGSIRAPVTVATGDLDAAFFDSYFDIWLPRLFFFLLPLFALILFSLFRKKSAFYLSHFIFSVHFHAFVLLIFSLYIFISSFLLEEAYFVNQLLLAGFLFITELYLFLALRRVYGEGFFRISLKLVLLNLLYILSVISIFTGIAVIIYSTQY